MKDQDDGLKKLLTWFLNLVMQLEAIQQSGAEPYERNATRTTQRNGYKERSLKTRVGDLELKKPQFRDRSFKSCVFDKYSLWVVSRKCCNFVAALYPTIITLRPSLNTFYLLPTPHLYLS
ncbi:transposase [Methanothrix sp.]|uniref:transposase n=1 Tax=Methanothrix sp. TaxID=90426 RepID=UPI003BB6D730